VHSTLCLSIAVARPRTCTLPIPLGNPAWTALRADLCYRSPNIELEGWRIKRFGVERTADRYFLVQVKRVLRALSVFKES
jgi:hypothetical protein